MAILLHKPGHPTNDRLSESEIEWLLTNGDMTKALYVPDDSPDVFYGLHVMSVSWPVAKNKQVRLSGAWIATQGRERAGQM